MIWQQVVLIVWFCVHAVLSTLIIGIRVTYTAGSSLVYIVCAALLVWMIATMPVLS